MRRAYYEVQVEHSWFAGSVRDIHQEREFRTVRIPIIDKAVTVIVDPVVADLGNAGIHCRIGVIAVHAYSGTVTVGIFETFVRYSVTVVVIAVADLRSARIRIWIRIITIVTSANWIVIYIAITIHILILRGSAAIPVNFITNLFPIRIDVRIRIIAIQATTCLVVVSISIGIPTAMTSDSSQAQLIMFLDFFIGERPIIEGNLVDDTFEPILAVASISDHEMLHVVSRNE